MQPTTSNYDSRLIVPYHVHKQTGFDNPFINRKGFIYLGVSMMSFAFWVSKRVEGSVSIRAAKKANIWLRAH